MGQELTEKLYQKTLGKEVSVLVESDKKGWTENYLPVILDGKVKQGEILELVITNYVPKWHQILKNQIKYILYLIMK